MDNQNKGSLREEILLLLSIIIILLAIAFSKAKLIYSIPLGIVTFFFEAFSMANRDANKINKILYSIFSPFAIIALYFWGLYLTKDIHNLTARAHKNYQSFIVIAVLLDIIYYRKVVVPKKRTCSSNNTSTILDEKQDSCSTGTGQYNEEDAEKFKFHPEYDSWHPIEEEPEPDMNRINLYNNKFDYMEGHDFEYFCADVLRRTGYSNVSVTPESRDQGIDIIAYKENVKYGIQCKCYSSDIGNSAVQEALAGAKFYDCHVPVVLTNRNFTKSARELAAKTNVLLWDRAYLEKLIEQADKATDVLENSIGQ